MSRPLKFAANAVFAIVVLAGAAWTATALWFHLAGLPLILGWALLAIAAGVAIYARARQPLLGWVVVGLAALLTAGWYATIRPSDDRDWAPDVARGVKAQVAGDLVTLSDVRDFHWQDPDHAEERWITRTVDLNQIETVDMLTSVWDNPEIAHLLVSFGFAGGEHVVFSVEIRREADESFNEIGGFFRQFELVLIAATEGDIVRLRTNHRKEEVRLYPIDLTPDQQRRLFLSYVTLAQELEAAPRFYNTVTSNCTTVVYGLAQVLNPSLPLDSSLILSGRLPEYIDAQGVLAGEGSVGDRRAAALITPKAQAAGEAADFSEAIRRPAAP
ncbi:MAG: DUF4105 domain-containing protein [Rhodobacteraceae bacterium]|nr:DUF4105 domain-containing protein [Paracoccaceae bacterium]